MPRNLINFCFMLLILAAIAILIRSYVPAQISDFPLYYESAQRYCAGAAPDVYLLNLQLGKLGAGLNEPPFLLWAVGPLGLLPYWAAKAVFDGAMFIVLSLSTVVLAKVAKLNGRQTLLMILLVVASGPVFEIIKVSKPSPLLFLGLTFCLAHLQRKEEFQAGAWATLCLVKPQEILPFFFLALGARRWRLICGCAAVVLVLMASTFPIYGLPGYANYIHRISYINAHPEFAGTDAMPILSGQLLRLSLLPAADATKLGNTIYLAGLLLLAALGHWYCKRKFELWWLVGALAVLAMACLLPYIYAYDLVITIPGICYLLRTLVQQKRRWLIGCVGISIFLFLDPVYMWVHYYPLSCLDLHFCALAVLSVVSILAAQRLSDKMTENAGQEQPS